MTPQQHAAPLLPRAPPGYNRQHRRKITVSTVATSQVDAVMEALADGSSSSVTALTAPSANPVRGKYGMGTPAWTSSCDATLDNAVVTWGPSTLPMTSRPRASANVDWGTEAAVAGLKLTQKADRSKTDSLSIKNAAGTELVSIVKELGVDGTRTIQWTGV